MTDTQILPEPPTARLKAVPQQIRELFGRYAALGPQEVPARKAVLREIQDLLRIHLEIEELVFYPAVQSMKADLAIGVVLKALQDHRKVKSLLDQLRERVLTHLHVEEREIFARLLPPETLRELSIEKLRDRLLGNQGDTE